MKLSIRVGIVLSSIVWIWVFAQVGAIAVPGLRPVRPGGRHYGGQVSGRIVFAAQRTRLDPEDPDKKVAYIDRSSHLFRVNPDGSRLVRLTNTAGRDTSPIWSPDGARILFNRWFDGDYVCVADRSGRNVRRLWEIPDGERFDSYRWAPNGRIVGVCLRRFDSKDLRYYQRLMLVDALGERRPRVIDNVEDFAWSPDSTRLYLGSDDDKDRIMDVRMGKSIAVSSPVWGEMWLDKHTIVGSTPTPGFLNIVPDNDDGVYSRIRMIGDDGRLISERLATRAFEIYDMTRARYNIQWYAAAGDRDHIVAHIHKHYSDGGDDYEFRVSLSSMKVLPLGIGVWCGLSPDGRYVASAESEWVPRYKGGGERVGPVRIVSTGSGKMVREITWPMGHVSGGDWR